MFLLQELVATQRAATKTRAQGAHDERDVLGRKNEELTRSNQALEHHLQVSFQGHLCVHVMHLSPCCWSLQAQNEVDALKRKNKQLHLRNQGLKHRVLVIFLRLGHAACEIRLTKAFIFLPAFGASAPCACMQD